MQIKIDKYLNKDNNLEIWNNQMYEFHRNPIVQNYLIFHVYELKEIIYHQQCVSATMPVSFGKS